MMGHLFFCGHVGDMEHNAELSSGLNRRPAAGEFWRHFQRKRVRR